MRTDVFNEKHIDAKLGNWGATEELVAVQKKPSYNASVVDGNDVTLLSTKELSQRAYDLVSNAGSCVI